MFLFVGAVQLTKVLKPEAYTYPTFVFCQVADQDIEDRVIWIITPFVDSLVCGELLTGLIFVYTREKSPMKHECSASCFAR
jgi:hypothetical protein